MLGTFSEQTYRAACGRQNSAGTARRRVRHRLEACATKGAFIESFILLSTGETPVPPIL